MNLRRLAALLLALLAAPLLTAPVAAAHGRHRSAGLRTAGLSIAGPWVTPAVAGRAGGGYLAITNNGKAPDTLLSAASPAATRITLHQMEMAGGVMRMRTLTSLTIPPGATLKLEPGGYHLMLEGLTRDLKAGQRIPAVLTFARAGNVNVQFQVRNDPMEGLRAGHR
jgi:copper(I)-binding protein